jgi:hypothetical protein
LIPASRSFLQAIANWLNSIYRAQWIICLCPELQSEWDYPTRVNFYDIYAEIEDWQDHYYRFSEVEKLIPDYSRAYKIIVCKHVSNKRPSLLFINATLAKSPIAVFGLACDAVEMLETYWSKSFFPFVKTLRAPWVLVNLFFTFIIQITAIGWVFFRTRVKKPNQQAFFFAADSNGDDRENEIYQNLADGGPVLLVRRNSTISLNKMFAGMECFTICDQKDGLFGLLEIPKIIKFIIWDSLCLFRHFYGLPSALFYQVAALPFRRAILRGFFNCYRPKYYWGRDDYNVEHTLRRDELNHVGGKSFGINHGTIVECFIRGEFRYINFDQYYVFGRGIHTAEMKKRWSSDMKVVPAGSFGATREDFKLRFKKRPPNILFCIGFFITMEECVELIRSVAKEFSDRKILLQLKPSFNNTATGKNFISACLDNNPNIENVIGSPIQSFSKVQYSFSDPSTTIQEAIQFGLKSFCLDLSPIQKHSIYRGFTDLCISSAEQAIGRIRSLESGKWDYPLEKYSDLIDLSGKVFIDRLREDVGLLAKEAAKPLINKEVIQKK